MAYLRLLRPEQWIKNVFLFAGLIFGGQLLNIPKVLDAFGGFALFCLLSSGVYVVNDIRDRVEDRLHPRKKRRPIASGEVSPQAGALIAAILLVVALGGAWQIDSKRGFFVVCLAYLVLQLTYTLALKHEVLVDVILIGIGFVLRAVAGAVLVQVPISHWLVLCTFTLCLFMGFSKRRCELNALNHDGSEDAAGRHRRTLTSYTPELLNHMTTLSAGIAVVSFMLYANDSRTVSTFHTNYLLYTLPLVVYAVFRFTLLVEHGRVDGPTDVILRDRPFQIAILLWVIAAVVVVYRGPALRDWLAGSLSA